MLADQPDQREQTDLGIDVHGGDTPGTNGNSAPTIAMGTLIMMTSGSRRLSNLRRQHQEDNDQREAEGNRQLIAFLHILPGNPPDNRD